MDGRMNGKMDRKMTNGQMYIWMDGGVDSWMERRLMDAWIGR